MSKTSRTRKRARTPVYAERLQVNDRMPPIKLPAGLLDRGIEDRLDVDRRWSVVPFVGRAVSWEGHAICSADGDALPASEVLTGEETTIDGAEGWRSGAGVGPLVPPADGSAASASPKIACLDTVE